MIDLVRAYNHTAVHPHDTRKTAITTPVGLFEFPFMSVGLRNAAQTFQYFMDDVLQGLIFYRSREEHEHRPTSEVRDPHEAGEMRFPTTRDHLPRF
jgi:hypothetical protein